MLQKYTLPLYLALMCTLTANAALLPFKFMQFNIEEGGTLVNFQTVLEAIRIADADVVAIEESDGSLPLLAQELSYPYYDTASQLLSRYPLINPPEAKGTYIFVELEPQKVIAVSNVHLGDDPYGPFEFYKGMTSEALTLLEHKTRLVTLKKHLEELPLLAHNKIPVFFAGDFNAPSHLDWNNDNCRFLWPVSTALEDAGFRDSYREIYPDPLRHPGFTWWAHRKPVDGWNPEPHDPRDRIDFIYSAGPSVTLDSMILGEVGAEDAAITFADWPSDHRALVSTFLVEPRELITDIRAR